jgi:hypothetical protein
LGAVAGEGAGLEWRKREAKGLGVALPPNVQARGRGALRSASETDRVGKSKVEDEEAAASAQFTRGEGEVAGERVCSAGWWAESASWKVRKREGGGCVLVSLWGCN